MRKFGPDTVIATYRVRRGDEDRFLGLVRRHWPTLDRLGLTNGEPSLVFRGKDGAGGTVFYEIFTWKDADAPRVAHEHPLVAEVWEAMEPLVEAREGRAKWEFPHVEPVPSPHARA